MVHCALQFTRLYQTPKMAAIGGQESYSGLSRSHGYVDCKAQRSVRHEITTKARYVLSQPLWAYFLIWIMSSH